MREREAQKSQTGKPIKLGGKYRPVCAGIYTILVRTRSTGVYISCHRCKVIFAQCVPAYIKLGSARVVWKACSGV